LGHLWPSWTIFNHLAPSRIDSIVVAAAAGHVNNRGYPKIWIFQGLANNNIKIKTNKIII
jgi:hypothetical protein